MSMRRLTSSEADRTSTTGTGWGGRVLARLAHVLNLRQGEGRTLAVMGAFLLLNTANTTLLSAAKNGLFLSVYPGELIPHAVIAAALLTAFVAILFTAVLAGTARRSLAVGLTVTLGLSVLACRWMFAVDARSAFLAYLWISAVQVLALTHAWDYAGDMLSGRQAKRLVPLIGVGASMGAILGGAGVAPAALGLGTENLLWISAALFVAALPLLWAVTEPVREPEEPLARMSAVHVFAQRASRGLRAVGGNPLLRLLAVGLVALTLTGTLIDLQLKFLLQETFSRDRITAIYGLLSSVVGAGTLVVQLWASRMLFPKFGVSVAALLHSGLLAIAAGGVAVAGGLAVLAVAQALDDILQFSLQKPVEQVSLLPFPARTKSVTLATMGGVLRPISKAAGGALALVHLARPEVLPLATVAAALAAVAAYSRHRGRYVSALEGALARHAIDFANLAHAPLVSDAGALAVIDRGLDDPDPTVAVFAVSLLEQVPAPQALPRVLALLGHDVPQVRAESARVFGRLDARLDFASGMAVAGRLATEKVPFVIASLLDTVGRLGGADPRMAEPFLAHADGGVRRAAIVALGRLGWPGAHEHIRIMLGSQDPTERVAGAGAIGDLAEPSLLEPLADILEDPSARPAALGSLVKLGARAVPVMEDLLGRRELPLPVRRSVVTALASIDAAEARSALLALVEEPALGPAALWSLSRLRTAGKMDAVEPHRLREVLSAEIQTGLRFAAAAAAIRRRAEGSRDSFVADELQSLQERSVQRVLRMLALSYDPKRIGVVADSLLGDSVARRGRALELLEDTISTSSGSLVTPFMEAVSEGLPIQRIEELMENGAGRRRDPAEALVEDADWWARSLALHVLERDDEITTPGHSHDDPMEANHMLPLIEKVMILKGSEFFRNFPGPDLAGIASLTDVVHMEKDEVLFQQGDPGDAFYMVVEGGIRISRGEHDLAVLGAREGFGEMAILDRDTRSATATATVPTTLLRLDRDSFDQVVEQNPAVARGIYRVLNERLRNTLARIAAG